MSLTSWFLVSSGGTRHRLPREMIFVGRDDCELMLQSRSVDKQHAVINYEASADEHLVKDLGSLNGTFVNDVRIPEQTYITLKLEDKLRFGYDTNLFTVVRGEMKVPEEALKHEKFTSQFQFSQKQFETEGSKCKSADTKANVSADVHHKALETLKSEEKLAADLSSMPRRTPLYGQPSWWGDQDAPGNTNNQESKEAKPHDASAPGSCKDVKKSTQVAALKEENANSFIREPSYFEIPSKELQQCSEGENATYEIPTQDPHSSQASGAGHASFTIEFDETSPGKVTIKDHITKFTDHRQKSKKTLSAGDKELAGLHTEMIAAESKVADWLAQNNPPRLLKEAAEEDSKSIKSDVPVYLKRLQGNKHEDGTQSDYENSATPKHANKCTNSQNCGRQTTSIEQRKLEQKLQTGGKQQETASQTAFLIEFLDDDHPRKRRSYSFSLNTSTAGPEAPYPIPQSRIDKVKAASVDPKGLCLGLQSVASSHRVIHSTQHAKLLLKQKSEEPCTSLLVSQNVLLRSSGSLGHRQANMRITSDSAELPSVEKDHKSSHLCEKANSKDDAGGQCVTEMSSSSKKRWASQWASLASNHVGQDQDNGQNDCNISPPAENDADMSESGMSLKSSGSAASVTCASDRKRRSLPKLPKEETNAYVSTSKQAHRSDVGEKQDTELQEKESHARLGKKDKLYVSNGKARTKQDKPTESSKDALLSARKHAVHKAHLEQMKDQLISAKLFNKPPVIQPSDSNSPNVYKQQSSETSQKKAAQKSEVVSNSNSVKSVESDRKETSRPLVRQGSFTIDKPSSNVPIELIPHINKQPVLSPNFPFTSVSSVRGRSDSVDTDSSMDTTLLLKDTEAVMAFLEAKLREDSKIDDDPQTPSYNQENSISPESDVDTASTISFVANDADRKCPQKRKTLTSLHKDKSSTSSPSKEPLSSSVSITRERKSKTHVREAGNRSDIQKVLRTSAKNRQPSLDLTDDDQTSSLPCSTVSDILSSDQETYSGRSHSKSQFASVDDKFTNIKTAAANKPVTLPRPRPTRTSLLRRSRLGEASDTEVGDNDRASVASEVSTTSSTSKQTATRKQLSRIDLLAQPRRTRLGSLSARSDSEATITRGSGASRASEYAVRSNAKMTPTTDGKGSPRARANSISRLSDAKTKVVPPVHGSLAGEFSCNTRWRRVPPEYASTSEDEFGSNRNPAKPTRLRASSAVKIQKSQVSGNSPIKTPSAALSISSFKHKAKEQEDYIRDWTAHREEIARISQDLALIAREINDVAGEIDSVTSSGTAPSTTVSTAATTPGSAIDTREELVDRVFDESLNFRKIPPSNSSRSEASLRAGDAKAQPKEISEPPLITRRKTWSRDEVMGDSLLLSSVFQFSRKIRQTIDKTANKIRILFKDKERNWDEIEKKLRSESEIPLLKTSCVEILSILQELKRIENQLQVINAMIDPDGTLDALNMLGFGSPFPSTHSNSKHSSSSVHSMNSSSASLPHIESRGSRSNVKAASSDADGVQSSPDFSLHFNRFNPDGKEDSTSHE
ncbi:PREDICTED: centrosomal protein of 170 kDa [Nanorana parkeri]|uniref:centrosomal protein of 170 kDa n=1 Tax=Nanorana parkeri TaxID=125878 RepID=UPI0008549EDB|nr:PREDICTED: centrosomal protein of 170 kDa [Nanorana parkeri]